jgi:twitching motility protein PilT
MDVFSLLRMGNSKRASDLHLVVGSPATFRIDGSLQPADGVATLTAEDINEAFLQLTTPEEREQFHRHLELDFGYTLPEVGRLRCNAAQQQGSISLAVRLLPPRIPTIEELELPAICRELALKPRGLVVVTGPTGSGKTTTMAAMIHHLNTHVTRHVVTIEDPIEYVFPSNKCAVTQRQLGSDTLSFANALKHILRQDPDVILVGEMRDPDTADAVLTVAETGHFILTTGHAPSATQAMERIIDLFPPHQRHLAQSRLASLLVAVLCQTLVPRADGSGRIAAVEIMLGNPPVKALVRDGKIYQLPNVIRTHRDIGMIMLDEALVSLYLDKTITSKTVLEYCNDQNEVEKLMGKVMVTSTG